MERIHLDLKVPRGWQQCSTRELEMIAEEMIRSQMNASLSRFHPFDWTEIKTRLFFRLSGVEVIDAQTSGPDIDAASQSNAQSGPVSSFRCRKDNLEFDLQAWQVHSFIDQLKWLDATDANGGPRPMPKLMWPYPERLWRWQWRRWMPAKDYYRPGELLDGMTWQQYRWISDWMEVYTNTANALIAEREKHAKADHERIRELTVQQAGARMEVLAQLFCVGDNAAPSKAKPAPRRLLRKITDVEWQVVLIWWSSMMQYLKEQYPKCFKSGGRPSRQKQQALPIELYTRSTATLQKYLGGLTEAEINAQTAHAILRHLNDMAIEAEEMEKLRRKHKR